MHYVLVKIKSWKSLTAFNKEKKRGRKHSQKRFIWGHDNWIDEKEKASTSIFWHSGNCLHDTDKVIFIVTELSKHIKQAASHDLPRKQQKRQVSGRPANTYECWMHTAAWHTALTELSSALHTHTHTRTWKWQEGLNPAKLTMKSMKTGTKHMTWAVLNCLQRTLNTLRPSGRL